MPNIYVVSCFAPFIQLTASILHSLCGPWTPPAFQTGGVQSTYPALAKLELPSKTDGKLIFYSIGDCPFVFFLLSPYLLHQHLRVSDSFLTLGQGEEPVQGKQARVSVCSAGAAHRSPSVGKMGRREHRGGPQLGRCPLGQVSSGGGLAGTSGCPGNPLVIF